MRFFLLVHFIVVLVASGSECLAQTFLTGTSLNYSFGIPLSIEREAGVVNRYGVITPGTSSEHTYGSGIHFFSPDLFNSSMGLSSNVAILLANGHFTSDPFTFRLHYDPLSQQNVLPSYRFDVVSNLSLLKWNTEFQYTLSKNLTLGTGVWIQYLLNTGFYQIETLLNYDSITFENGKRTQLVNAGENLAGPRFRFGPQLSLNYLVPISDQYYILPSIGTTFDLATIADVLSPGGWKFNAGLSLLFKTEGTPPIEIQNDGGIPAVPIDTLTSSSEIPNSKPVTARLYSIVDGKDVHYGEFKKQTKHYKRTVLFSNTIKFNDSDAFFKKLSHTAAESFSEEALFKADISEIQKNMVNVLAYRCKQDPTAILQFTYVPSSKRGAELVQNYLTTIWGIDKKRIEIKSSRSIDSPSLQVASFPSSICDPLEAEWIEQSYEMAPLKFIHSITPHERIDHWKLLIKGNEKQLTSLAGTNLDQLNGVNPSVGFSGKNPPTSLVLDFEFANEQDVEFICHDTIPLKETDEVRESSTEYFIPSTESLSDQLVVDIKSSTGTAKTVKITIPKEGSSTVKNNFQILWRQLGDEVAKSSQNVYLHSNNEQIEGIQVQITGD